MPSKKGPKTTTYPMQIVLILSVFFFVLFNLIFRLIIDLRSDALQREAERKEQERIKKEFIVNIEDRYAQLLKLYEAKQYEKAIQIIKVFNEYGESDYRHLPEIKKDIRLFYLKKKLEFIPKIHLAEYMELSKDIDIEEDDSTEVFIRTPRYGQYFYTSDLPLHLEGVALSVKGDFSDKIIWSSSIDGELGTGKSIKANLSVGTHKITAVGSNGVTTGAMSTRVHIEKDPEFLKDYHRD